MKQQGRWIVAVTTAPRRIQSLQRCIDSIRKCGWEPIVFAEPGSHVVDCETVWNAEKKGLWHNWYHCAQQCLLTGAEWILTVQDDSEFHPDSKIIADAIINKDVLPGNTGFMSFYTPAHYSKKKMPGVNRIKTEWLWGACALAFPRHSLHQILNHKIATEWIGVGPRNGREAVLQRRREDPTLINNSDTAIGKCCNALNMPMMFMDPSPVRHFSSVSTVGHGGNHGRRNCGRCADFSIPLNNQLPARVSK